MKRSLIGLFFISFALVTPSFNNFDSIQNFRLEIGQSAEAAPKFKLPKLPKIPPSIRQKILRFLGNKAGRYIIKQTRSTIFNSTNSHPQSSNIHFVGNLCKSEAGTVYLITSNGKWSYFNGSQFQDISHPYYTVACYIDLGTNSSGELYWSDSSQIFGYVPNVGLVIPQ
ncbi:hypothetical protein [Nostoc sp. NMS8]|uniref:hypothetical protein n=1 Tax=Nostoc sp. NMS8 TaxID=2815392 RepID=UPI0025DB1114|nr:hypothetical protein [Nostoc sp. NMS8]MBN3958734.1 hypothetical protein [Nostoc sp. NMS8]